MTQLLLNGRVHSPAMPDATALAVRDGVVAWVGSDDVGRAQFPDAQISDLDGAFVAPAFVDSHVHLTATGLTLIGLDLRAATSLRHCLHLLGEHTRAHPDGVIWAHGWDESGWPERTPPSTADVDAAVGDRPAYLARVDVHSAAASTALRALAAGLPDAGGYAPQHPLTGDAHHLVRAVARDRLTPGSGTRPVRPHWTPRPRWASSRCTNARAPRSAASTTGTRSGASSTASTSSATGVRRSATPERPVP